MWDEAASIDEHKAVLDEALDIYVERNSVHQDLWKQDGATGNLQHVRSKVLRVINQMGNVALSDGEEQKLYLDQLVDDGLDAINYLAMLIRNAREGRLESKL